MKESYIKELASHDGPEPCVGVPRGRSEALDRGVRRRAIELRKALSWGADAFLAVGRQHRWRRFREPLADPTESENLCMRTISLYSRSGRAHGCPCSLTMPRPFVGRGVAGRRAPGRAGNAKAVIL
jgi:hypothetical protein